MDTLELQLRGCSRSWLAWSGALAITAVFGAGVAVTGVTPERVAPPELPTLSLAYARPAPPEPQEILPQPRVAMLPDLAEAFRFDPPTAERTPEIPLGSLDMTTLGGGLKLFDPMSTGGFAAHGAGAGGWGVLQGLENSFEVRKPDLTGRFTIFERAQVDEIPVWLYGPQPRAPDRYDRADWNALVLYTVSERGKTENIFVLDSTDATLNEPVKRAISEWRFRPARKDGKPVKMWVQQAVNHQPENKSPFTL